jgi:hypothetical protein
LLAGALLAACVPAGAQPPAARASLEPIAPIANDGPIGYFVGDPPAAAGAGAGDAELCAWALDDWVAHAEGRLSVEAVAESAALIRIYFVAPGAGQYGEMRPMLLGGRRGALVYVRPETDALGPDIAAAAREDPLLRETIVYLTCLHEIGHALGLEHTAEFADIMYFFGYGGDIPVFFGRYRSRIETRADIARVSGLSAGDIERLLRAYPVD